MKTKFNEFLKEEYFGPNKAAGFMWSEPTDEYTVSFDVKTALETVEIKDIVDAIFTKYKIHKTDIDVKKVQRSRGLKTIMVKFKSYSSMEVNSIINSILTDLHGMDIMIIIFDSIKVENEKYGEISPGQVINPINKRLPIGFHKSNK